MFDMDKETTEGLQTMGEAAAQKAGKAYEAVEEGAVHTYQKIEDTVVGGYRKMEDAVVGGYRKIENAFVEKFFARDGETPEEAKVRMTQEYEAREEKLHADMEKRARAQQEIINRANNIR